MKKRVLFFCFALLFSALGISQTSTLPPPSNLVSSDIDANNATLRWNSDENALSWIVNYSVTQSEQVFSMEVTDTIVYITNLIEGTRYNWKVRMIDLQGDTTAWSELASFFTSGFDNNCPKLENLSVSDINTNGITIQWVPEQENGTWEVVYDLAGSNPEHEGFSGTTQNHEFTANRDLIEHTRYQLAIRTHCTNTVSDWTYLYARYLTENSIHELPIQLDFEDESDNLNIGFVNSVNNPWEIADAENASSIGSKAMYISNDSGETFGCDPSTASVSYAYMDFYIPDYAISYYIDFKYKSQAPLQNASLKIYMISTGEPLNLTNLPNEEFRVGSIIYSGSDNEWISEHIELPTQYIGTTRRLLFAWSNQPGADNNNAIAIDDIYLTARYCAIPTNLSVPSTDDNSALITWDFQENQTSFNLQYKPTQSTQWTELSGISPNYVLNDLQASTSYTFRVQADCGQEQSFWSDTAVFSTNMLIENPSNVELTFVDESSAQLRWNNDQNASLWIVDLKDMSTQNIQYFNSTNNSININGLMSNTLYSAKIRAVSLDGDTSDYSSECIIHTLCNATNDFPYVAEDTIHFSSLSSFCTDIECWRIMNDTVFSPVFDFSEMANPSLTFNYHSETGSYNKLLVSTDNEPFIQIPLNFSNGNNRLLLSNLLATEKVRFAIQSQLEDGAERTYIITDFTIKDSCSTPSDLTVNQTADNQVRVDWTPYTNNTSFNLKLINSTDEDTIFYNEVTNPFDIEELVSGKDYKIQLFALCGQINSNDFSEAAFSIENSSDYCPVPTNFVCQHYQNKGDETIVCTWDDVEENPFIQWEINYKEQYALEYTSSIVSIYPRFSLRNLEMGQVYDFRLRAICSPGEMSEWTDVQQVIVGEQSLDVNVYADKYIKLFPNPADSTLFIETNALEMKDAQLIDANGRVIRAWDNLPTEIDVSSIESGNYILKVFLDKMQVSKKISIL